MNILCKMGIHKWKQSRAFHILDIHPLLYSNYKSPKRKCERCGKTQEWLPGHGGSEIGCWVSQGGLNEKNISRKEGRNDNKRKN